MKDPQHAYSTQMKVFDGKEALEKLFLLNNELN
ncbi:hypothetical protein AAZX31_04G110800 [Glycine max]